jgi:hypothetical protein
MGEVEAGAKLEIQERMRFLTRFLPDLRDLKGGEEGRGTSNGAQAAASECKIREVLSLRCTVLPGNIAPHLWIQSRPISWW